MDTFGRRERGNPDWFEASIAYMEPAIEVKKMALINYKREPSKKTFAAIRKPKDDAERIAEHFANDYWLNLCQGIQLSADYGNLRGMYDGMRKVFGPCINKIMPLKATSGTIITDRSKQMDMWAEYFQELYSRENIVADTAVEGTVNLPVTVEHDTPPSVEELSTAVNSLACGSSRLEKKAVLLHYLHQLLLRR